MSETVGRVDFMAALDGSRAVRESEALGRRIGEEGDKAGAGFGDNFDSELTPRMRETTSKLGKMLNESLELDDAVVRKNSLAIRTFGRDGETAIDRMANRMFAFGVTSEDAVRKAFGDDGRIRKFWDDLDVGSARLDGLNLKWQDLSHNTRQWTLIIGAVLAGMQDLAVLSSAAGAGLLAVGGGLSAAVLGAGAIVAVFSTLSKDINELPPSLRETAVEFRELGGALKETRDIISSAALAEMPDTFSRLQGTVEALNPSFGRLGTAVGTVFDDFSRGVAVGTDGFDQLDTLINNAADDFPKLASAAGTWSVGLLRGLNRANPMVDQLIGYVEKLGDRFDRFTRSDSFGQWIGQSMQTWREFGDLLDATGRALNDLVTPSSVVRTQEFLRNLTEFMPNLSRLLDVLGRVDVFGLAAQALNDLGEAFEPLAEPAGRLADSFNEIASIVIDKLAVALGEIVQIIEPVVSGLANVVDAIPPGVLDFIVSGVVGLAAAFVILKGVQGVAGAVEALGIFTNVAGLASDSAGKLAGALKTGLGKAGAAGIAIVGVAALASGIVEAMEKMHGLDDAARDAVAGNKSLADSMKEVYAGGAEITQNLDDVLNRMGELDNFFVYITALDSVGNEAVQLATSLQKLSPELATLAGQDLAQATSQFASWAEELGASDKQVLNMLENMPEFKQALIDAAGANGEMLTSQELVALALGETKVGIDEEVTVLDELATRATLTSEEFGAFSDRLFEFTQKIFESRDAAREFYASMDELDAALAENGAVLDITTAAGRANEEAIDAMAQSALVYADQIRSTTGDQAAANDVIVQARADLLDTLAAFGITGEEAGNYANTLGLIPDSVLTTVTANGLADAYNTTGNLKYRLEQLNGSVYSYTLRGTYIQMGNREITAPEYARGGTVNGAQHAIVGEAGPEAIVPLRRPLSQVDPSVRWLSAIAQGMKAPAMASGGIMGGRPSTTVIFEAGSIIVEGSDDPRQTAYDVLDVVSENIGS